ATVAGVTENHMGEYCKSEEDDHGDRYLTENPSLAEPDKIGLEAADRSTRGEEERSAPEGGHTAERDDKRRDLQASDGKTLEESTNQPHSNRSERSKIPAVAGGLLAGAHIET